jgi:hypothetical protein
MGGEETLHQIDSLLCGHIRKSEETTMECVVNKQKLPEIFVDGDQNPIVVRRPTEKRSVSRVGPKFAGLHHIITLAAKPFGQTAPGATVDEESHRG